MRDQIRARLILERTDFFYARVRWTGEDGKRRDYRIKGKKTESEAWKALNKVKTQLESDGPKTVDAARIKFSDLAGAYEKARLYPAKIVDGKKVGGVKSLGPVLASLTVLKDHFGHQKISSLRHSDLVTFKQKRLDTPTIHGTQRKIASVNRELELARAIFKFAIQERWITISPFVGKAIIDKTAENRRERVLSDAEEIRLLEACHRVDKYGHQRRLRIVPMLITSWDTGIRCNELLRLTWNDIDFNAGRFGTITVVAQNSKTERRRVIGMTPRLRESLLEQRNLTGLDPDARIFGYKSAPKAAFMAALRDANIEDYRWHDGRHTATTRMMEATNNAELVKKITGHTQHSTFARYYNPNMDTITSVAEALGERNQSKLDSLSLDNARNLCRGTRTAPKSKSGVERAST
ncbi:MAG: tyrosine-type recombinase/integrase [Acidobacteria bacterium]|nr:tyrosine-type recombinase/integrase [Acidobacteriota bacterium]